MRLYLTRIAQVYDAQGDFKQAIEHLLSALRIHESLNSRQEVARVYGSIGLGLYQSKECFNGCKLRAAFIAIDETN